MSIYAALRGRVESGDDPEAAADAVLWTMRKADLAAIVRPLLVNEARRSQRANVRQIEAEAFRRIADGEDPVSVRRKLSETTFVLPSGEYVSWLDATVDQHLARAGWQRSLASACTTDAERHESAAESIRAAGVSCLRDLETQEGAA